MRLKPRERGRLLEDKREKMITRKQMMKQGFIHRFFLILVLVPFICVSVFAEDSRGGIQIDWENDWFAGTDRGFTNGMKLTWVTPLNLLRTRMARLNTSPPDLRQGLFFTVGQNMYTPENILNPDLIPDDRPYGGFLFGEVGIIRRSSSRLDLLSILGGVVGPLSQAEYFQKFIHKATTSSYPRGWEHQLPNEVVFQLFLEQKRKLDLTPGQTNSGLELLPQYGLGLGNLYIYVHGGFQLRLGWNLPDDFGCPTLRPGGDSVGTDGRLWSRSEDRSFGFFIFGSINSQYVVRNMFLDGTIWTESHSVEKNSFVWNAAAGVGISVKGFQLRAAMVYWTKKFLLQEFNHLYATFQAGFSF